MKNILFHHIQFFLDVPVFYICVKQLFLYALSKMLLLQVYIIIFKQQKNQTAFQLLLFFYIWSW